jgi:hypothetical protein
MARLGCLLQIPGPFWEAGCGFFRLDVLHMQRRACVLLCEKKIYGHGDGGLHSWFFRWSKSTSAHATTC